MIYILKNLTKKSSGYLGRKKLLLKGISQNLKSFYEKWDWEAYLGPCKTYMTELYAKGVHDFQTFSIFEEKAPSEIS